MAGSQAVWDTALSQFVPSSIWKVCLNTETESLTEFVHLSAMTCIPADKLTDSNTYWQNLPSTAFTPVASPCISFLKGLLAFDSTSVSCIADIAQARAQQSELQQEATTNSVIDHEEHLTSQRTIILLLKLAELISHVKYQAAELSTATTAIWEMLSKVMDPFSGQNDNRDAESKAADVEVEQTVSTLLVELLVPWLRRFTQSDVQGEAAGCCKCLTLVRSLLPPSIPAVAHHVGSALIKHGDASVQLA